MSDKKPCSNCINAFRSLIISSAAFVLSAALASCAAPASTASGTASDSQSVTSGYTGAIDAECLVDDASLKSAADNMVLKNNPYQDLSVPTYFTRIDGTYFIVDCYHDQVIYSTDPGKPLSDWYVMTDEISRGHTIAGDGTVYLVDDTENNRILIFQKCDGKFIHTQTLPDIGVRPHYIVYNEQDSTFYAWSSMTGEMYLIKRHPDSTGVYVAGIRKNDTLNGVYVRSFTIDLKRKCVYFVSGNSSIIEAGLSDFAVPSADSCASSQDITGDFKIKKEYPVPGSMAGMVQITPVDRQFYITISTDASMNQDCATIIRCDKLSDLSKGRFEDIYSSFIGGGTPYYITKIDDTYYLTEHRIPGHSIWSFKVSADGLPEDIKTVF
jgi:hypothetical protein